MSNSFYRALEERFRENRELIKSRLRVYLPFIEPLAKVYKDAAAIDLGCGRGEWLELLTAAGFQAHGVDLDDGMLEACRERGLNVQTQDVIIALKALPDASHAIVSGFHIVEHIPFSDLQILVQEALRVLQPGGLLIMETPNPENILVGTTNFYLDPTHQRPIPPQLLEFLPRHYGFARIKILRLQEGENIQNNPSVPLFTVLAGVSPDYSVVAQKAAETVLSSTFDNVFRHEYGITLATLAQRYDDINRAKVEEVQSEARAANANIQQWQQQAMSLQHALDAQTLTLKLQITETQHIQTKAHEQEQRAQQAEASAQHWQAEAQATTFRLESTAAEFERRLENTEARAQHWQAEAQATQVRLEASTAELEHRLSDAEARAQQTESSAQHWQAETQATQVRLEASTAEFERRLAETEANTRHWYAEAVSTKSLLEARTAELEGHLAQAESRVRQAEDGMHHWWNQSNQWHEYIHSIHRSTSWRLTGPMRAVKRVASGDFTPLRRLGRLMAKGAKCVLRPLGIVAMWATLKQPTLRYRLNKILLNYPRLRHNLVLFALNRGLLSEPTTPLDNTPKDQPPTPNTAEQTEEIEKTTSAMEQIEETTSVMEQAENAASAQEHARATKLTPRARQIYADIKSTLEKNREAC